MFLFDNKKKFEELQFPQCIEVNNIKYIINVTFASKRSSSVVIRDNKLMFRMSSHLSKKQAQQHFAELLKKIHKRLEKTPIQKTKTIQDILQEMQFNFSDTTYKLEYTTAYRGVRYENQTFYINIKTKPENIEKHIITKLIQIYTTRIQNYTSAINQKTYNFPIKDIELKLVNSKWGHCTHDNKLMFNIKLLNAPIEILNYVIIHELAHIKHKNHSQTYWKEVSRFCPNYKRIRKMLKDNPPQIYQ